MFPLAPLALLLAAAPSGAAERAVHRVSIEIRGPVAMVDVERSLAEVSARREEAVLDLALPEGAVLTGWQVAGPGELRLTATEEVRARKEHAAALATRSLGPTRIALDEGTDYRVHVAAPAGRRPIVRYQYVAPLGCRRGRFVLSLPGSLEAEPLAAEISVLVAPGAGGRLADLDVAGVPARAGRATVRAAGKAPARAAWEVSFTLHAPSARFPLQILAAAARVPALGRTGSETAVALGVCRPEAVSERAAPERVLLVIDRSRSVGPAGIASERDVARALVEALPPAVRFNAVFFDRGTRPLFPVARSATEEALAALDEQAGPGQLANGTELGKAVRAAVELARAEGDPRPTWLALITDGAVPETQTAAALVDAAAGLPPSKTQALALVVRPGGDEPPPGAAQAVLRALPAHFGGVLRTIDPSDVRTAIADVVKAARGGGDLFSVNVGKHEAIGAVPPGGGQVRVVRVPPGSPSTMSARRSGGAFTSPLAPAAVPREAMAALAARPPARLAWAASTAERLVWVEPGAQAPAAAEDEVTRGEMDKQVVRNALSLAYLPRARACYLGRRVRTPADFELRGKLRLELTLERGEMLQAVVRNSTLNRPDIEACLREAAFGIEVPRPLHRDALVVAALNLRFQPRTPAQPPPDASPLSQEIDLLIGPITFPTDPRQVLEELGP